MAGEGGAHATSAGAVGARVGQLRLTNADTPSLPFPHSTPRDSVTHPRQTAKEREREGESGGERERRRKGKTKRVI